MCQSMRYYADKHRTILDCLLAWTVYSPHWSTWPTCTPFYWFQPSARAICETAYYRQPGLPGRRTPRGAGVPPFRLCSSLVHSLPHLLLFIITFSPFPFLIHFTYFLLLSIRSLSTRIVPLRFQARGRRGRPNLGLVCFVLLLCYLYCLVKIYSGILLYLA